MDELDRALVNQLQGGFPVCDRPYAEVGRELGLPETEVIRRIGRLLTDGVLTRFGPMYHAERLGGALSLCAMRVPVDVFEEVASVVNGFPQVAHNYAREHDFNMWFVLATETPEGVGEAIADIEGLTGLKVYDMPKLEEFFVELKLSA